MSKLLLAVLAIAVAVVECSVARSQPASQKEKPMTQHATGAFDVKVAPLPAYDQSADTTLGRYSLDKQYHGDLDATAVGEMLTATTSVQGSAGAVATERVTGTLQGRRGSFILLHKSTMANGAFHMDITVVPDSGAGDLAGITGKLNIRIEPGGKHFYDFDYALPPAAAPGQK